MISPSKYSRLQRALPPFQATPARGFTLLETIIAMSLLALVLVGAFSLLVGSYATTRRTQESLYVTRVLETAIEMTRNLSFADIAGDPSGSPAGYAAATPVTFSTASTLITGANNEILFSKGPVESSDPKSGMVLQDSAGRIHFEKLSNDLYKVTAAVTYTPFRRGPVTRNVTTYIARQGINRR